MEATYRSDPTRHRPETRRPASQESGPCVPATPTNVPEPSRTDPALIRNFCIIAHIDHGKSTLADRMLQLTGVVDQRQMRAQYLDRMDIERERGITIKSQAVRLPWAPTEGEDKGTTHILNMIDTPGHVDFTYEVSRSLAACEGTRPAGRRRPGHRGADARQPLPGDGERPHHHPGAQQDRPARRAAREVRRGAGATSSAASPRTCSRSPRRPASAWTRCSTRSSGTCPAPVGVADAPARAMIFDSVYDAYRGVVTYVRVVDGQLNKRERIRMMSTGATHELLEIGVSSPEMTPADGLGVGEVGYIITGVKDVRQSKVGDTITSLQQGRDRGAGRLQGPQADGVLRPLSAGRLRLPGAARRPGQAPAQRRRPGRTSRRPPPRSASASASASSACCTWT